jgi:hypothetical protein
MGYANEWEQAMQQLGERKDLTLYSFEIMDRNDGRMMEVFTLVQSNGDGTSTPLLKDTGALNVIMYLQGCL